MNLRLLPVILISILLATGCSSSKKLSRISGLRPVNEYVLPNGQQLEGTTIGGLSGIDYDAKKDQYYLICDDPSSKGPARFYTARIPISAQGIDSVLITGVTILRDPAGLPYPDITKDRTHSADLEAMRYDPFRHEMIWSSEGQRHLKEGKLQLQDPAIVVTDTNGRYKASFVLPDNMHIQATEKGPRHNSVFEGLTFPFLRHVYVSVEEPLYEDGPRAGLGDSAAWVRWLKLDRQTLKQVAQYAYRIDPVPFPANPPGAFKVNGISDILQVSPYKFLVIERGYSTGRVNSDVRIYLADLQGAEDISQNPSLAAQPVRKPITKKLLLDMNSLGRFIDNIEGVTFGPTLPNGHRSLIFVADNNFDNREKNQFFLFEVLP